MKGHRKGTFIICKICGKEFHRSPSKKAKFCSPKCFQKQRNPWNKGLTKEIDERVRKFSEKRKSWKPSVETKNRMKETKNSQEYKEKIKKQIGELQRQEWGRLSWKGNVEEHKEKIRTSVIEVMNKSEMKEHLRQKALEQFKDGMPKETKEKIRGKMKGKRYSLGYRHTKEHNKKISEARQGEKHPNWQGGKSFEPYTYDFNSRFKVAIKERDHNCCQLCNVGEIDLKELKRYLMVHHVDYDKLNSFPQNCITLCNKCHMLTNGNRIHWKTFFQNSLKEKHDYKYTSTQKIILDFK